MWTVQKILKLEPEQLQQLHSGMCWDSALFTEVTKDNSLRPLDMCDSHRQVYKYHDEMTEGIFSNLAMVVYRGFSKCLHEDTLIEMCDGTVKSVQDIVVGDKIISLNESTLKLEHDTVSYKWNSGVKDLIKVHTRSGKIIKCTGEHKVFTFDGWKRASDLTMQDRIASPRLLPECTANNNYSDEEVKIIAYMIAEGSLSGGNCKFTNEDESIVSDMKQCCESLGWEFFQSGKPIDYALRYRGVGTRTKGPRAYFKNLGMYGHTAKTKRIPEDMFSISTRQKWLFIEAMMVTDGYFTSHDAQITLANYELIKDFSRLLSMVGILSSVNFKQAGFNGKLFDAWSCRFTDENIKLIVDNCDLKFKREKACKILDKPRYSLIDTYPTSIKKHITKTKNQIRVATGINLYQDCDVTRGKIIKLAEYLDSNIYRMYDDADVFWDQIKSISKIESSETYDIEIEKNHNFIADGLVVHNSTIKKDKTLQEIAYGHEKVIGYVHETRDQAKKDLEAVKRQIVHNEKLNLLFGNMKGSEWGAYGSTFHREGDPSKWTYAEATGMTSRIRGINKFDVRLTKAYSDDFESKRNSHSPSAREKVREKILEELLPAGEAGNYRLAFQGTIVHPDSYLNLIKKDIEAGRPSVFSGKLGRYFERALSTDPYNGGTFTWEELHGREFYETQKLKYTTGSKNEFWKFLQEYYNIPPQQSNPTFKVDSIKELNATFCKAGHITYLKMSTGQKIPINVYIGIDPAYTFTERSDRTAIAAIGVTPDDTIILLDLFADKVDIDGKADKLMEFAKKYSPRHITIESYGAAMELPGYFKKKMLASGNRWRVKLFGKRKSKAHKFMEGMETIVNNGRLFYLNTCQNIELLKLEATAFNGMEREHDDTLDALYLALNEYRACRKLDVDRELRELRQQEKGYNPYDSFTNASYANTTIRNWRR